MTTERDKLTVLDTVTLPLLAAVMLVGKFALNALPNIEVVSLLTAVYTVCIGKKAIIPVYLFVIIEGVVYGFGTWWLSYLYVWPLLYLAVLAIRKIEGTVICTLVCAMFGLLFGALCSVPQFIIGGISYGTAYFISGIPFDLLHCAGNAVLTAVLYKPLKLLLTRCLTMKRA